MTSSRAKNMALSGHGGSLSFASCLWRREKPTKVNCMGRKKEVPKHLRNPLGLHGTAVAGLRSPGERTPWRLLLPWCTPSPLTNTSLGGAVQAEVQPQLSIRDINGVMRQPNYNSHQATQEYTEIKTFFSFFLSVPFFCEILVISRESSQFSWR